MSDHPSYHDLHITTANITRTSIFNLPYGLAVRCCRVAGWELWQYPDHGPEILVAGEYDTNWLILDVDGHEIVNSRDREDAEDHQDHEDPDPDLGLGGWTGVVHSGTPADG